MRVVLVLFIASVFNGVFFLFKREFLLVFLHDGPGIVWNLVKALVLPFAYDIFEAITFVLPIYINTPAIALQKFIINSSKY